jgi:hypothetical protein
MVNGFGNTMRGYSALITRSPAFKASRAEQLKMAVGLETILHTRARTMGDLVDSSAVQRRWKRVWSALPMHSESSR